MPSFVWALGTVPSHSFERFFIQPWVIFSHNHAGQTLLNTCRDRALFVQLLPLQSSVLRTGATLVSSTEVLLQTPSGTLLPLLWPGRWNGHTANSIYFMFLKDHVIHCLMNDVLKTSFLYLFFLYFGLFKVEGKSGPCYSILARSRGFLIILFKTKYYFVF